MIPDSKTHRRKTIAFLMAVLALTLSLSAKDALAPFSKKNVESATAIVSYTKDHQGFWNKNAPTEIVVDTRPGQESLIGKFNKNRALYVRTDTSIIELILDKKSYSEYKNDKTLRNLKEEEWNVLFLSESEKFASYFQLLNKNRSKAIADSIAEVRRLEELRAQEAARREAARRDSILSAQADREYRETSNSMVLDLTSLKKKLSYSDERSLLRCIVDGCDESISGSEIHPFLVKNDTLVYGEFEKLPLGHQNLKMHALLMNDKFRHDPVVSRHLRVWSDSLAVDPGSMLEAGSVIDYIDMLNFISFQDAIASIKKLAPNGYVDSWSWDNEYGPVSLNITYCNTNKKTIKYLKVFFSIYNDVGDLRGSGSVQGTGPVNEFCTGTWDFDYTGCWVSGDATRMKITKIVITYMNGSTATLTGKKIVYD